VFTNCAKESSPAHSGSSKNTTSQSILRTLHKCCANMRSQLLQFCMFHFYTSSLCDTLKFQYRIDIANIVDGAVVILWGGAIEWMVLL